MRHGSSAAGVGRRNGVGPQGPTFSEQSAHSEGMVEAAPLSSPKGVPPPLDEPWELIAVSVAVTSAGSASRTTPNAPSRPVPAKSESPERSWSPLSYAPVAALHMDGRR